MTEKEDESHEGDNPDADSEATRTERPILPVAPQDRIPETAQTRDTNTNTQPTAQQVRRELHWLEILNFCGQIVLAIVGIAAVCIYGSQLSVMRGQLEQMKQSSGQTDKLICLYQEQLAQLTKQAGDTHDLAVAAGKQADAAKKTAEAANSAAKTAESTLHVSERAYISSGAPQIDPSKKAIYIPLTNSGHIPSGRIDVVFYQATFTFTPETIGSTNIIHLTARHKHASHFTSIAPGLPLSIFAPISDLSEDKLNSGLQKIMVLGTATYNDGFPNTPKQRWSFCESTVYRATVKQYFLEPCDPSAELPKFESLNWQ